MLVTDPVVVIHGNAIVVQVERPARHVATLANNHTVGLWRDHDVGGDAIRAVLQIDDGALGHANVGFGVGHLGQTPEIGWGKDSD